MEPRDPEARSRSPQRNRCLENRFTPWSRSAPTRYRALSFPEVEGKKTARVELVTSGEYHAVVVVFDDNTAVGFEFQPCFTVRAFGENIDAIGGNGSKTWPKMLSES